MLIVLEGIDQSGKKTQAKLLKERLEKEGYEVEIISFPDYSTPIGREIKAFLKGKRKYDPLLRQVLYVANRWENKGKIEGWIEKGKMVIADRYIPSGLAYGFANGLDLNQMLTLERGLPEPNLIIVLDVTIDTAFKRKGLRDVYEKDKAFLERVRDAYLKLGEKFDWKIIDGERSIYEIHEEIWSLISSVLSA